MNCYSISSSCKCLKGTCKLRLLEKINPQTYPISIKSSSKTMHSTLHHAHEICCICHVRIRMKTYNGNIVYQLSQMLQSNAA